MSNTKRCESEKELLSALDKIEDDRLYTAKEVAAILQVSPKVVYGLIKDKEIGAFHFGGRYKIPDVAIRKYIASLSN